MTFYAGTQNKMISSVICSITEYMTGIAMCIYLSIKTITSEQTLEFDMSL